MAKLIGNQFLELNAVLIDENAITEEKFKTVIMVDNITGVTPTTKLTAIDGIVIGKNHPFLDYAIQTIIFIVVFGLGTYLDDKGWNSWKKIRSLFKRKKADD